LMTLANAPLWLETRDSVPLICPTAPAKYFCKGVWTQNSPPGKSPGPRTPSHAIGQFREAASGDKRPGMTPNKKRDGIAPVAFQLL
jgi:hypothetical protein